MSAPDTAAAISWWLSCAASSPSSGLPPVPAGEGQGKVGMNSHALGMMLGLEGSLGDPPRPRSSQAGLRQGLGPPEGLWQAAQAGREAGGLGCWCGHRAAARKPKGRTQAARQLRADLQLVHRLVVLQRLRVSVDRPELHALRVECTKGSDRKQCVGPGRWERARWRHGRREPRALLPAAPLTDRPLEIMRFTALPPPPPQPTTLMRASPGERGGRCRG